MQIYTHTKCVSTSAFSSLHTNRTVIGVMRWCVNMWACIIIWGRMAMLHSIIHNTTATTTTTMTNKKTSHEANERHTPNVSTHWTQSWENHLIRSTSITPIQATMKQYQCRSFEYGSWSFHIGCFAIASHIFLKEIFASNFISFHILFNKNKNFSFFPYTE